MIRNNLASLLVERNMKATEVSERTGIARSTLSRISNNSTAKIEYDTINQLCHVLKITPKDFFSYNPYDCSVEFEITEEEEKKGMAILTIHFKMYGDDYTSIRYKGFFEREYERKDDQMIKFKFAPFEEENTDVFEEIDITFRSMLKNDIQRYLTNTIFDSENFFMVTVEVDIFFENLPYL